MRVLLTGASGLVGSAVARRLSEQHDVVSVGRRSSAHIQVDLGDLLAVSGIDPGRIDALVHCAGVIDEDFRDHPQPALERAVFGTDALVRAALKAGATRLLYVSSAHCYGPMVGRVDERSASNPVSDYAIAHFATEQVLRRHAAGIAAGASLRPCAVFGDLPDPSRFRRWALIPFSFPREALVDHRIVIKSSGEQRRNYVGTQDIADCCAAWLATDGNGWSILNPVGALSASVYEFAQLCAAVSKEISGQPCEVIREPIYGRTIGDDFTYQTTASITRGQQDLRETMATLMRAIQELG